MANYDNLSISFTTLIKGYAKLQSAVMQRVRALSSNLSSVTPASFILLQFQMAQVTQVGESISNLVSQVNTMIGNAIRNFKTQ
jgi:hypothetical protein